MVPNQETEMISRARSGDQAAYEHLYRQYATTVRSWCWHMTRNYADADDLAQEVFMRLFVKLPTFRCESTLRTWLYRVVVNCALMQFRKQKRTSRSLHSILPRETSLRSPELPLEIAIPASAGARVIIKQALQGLPPAKRSVFLMHDVSGFTHQEIAQRLCVSIESSKCRLRRARMQLRSALSA